jgi:hypothetical protein
VLSMTCLMLNMVKFVALNGVYAMLEVELKNNRDGFPLL